MQICHFMGVFLAVVRTGQLMGVVHLGCLSDSLLLVWRSWAVCGGLTFLACLCAFGGFLLWFLLVYTCQSVASLCTKPVISVTFSEPFPLALVFTVPGPW